ncbi:MAG: nucleotidyl transferase AbiEii/AbiGii toxin family protein [Acidobacteriota bacterium]
MIELTEAEIKDLAELQQLCVALQSDLVIVGAIAYQHYFPDDERHTSDIDSAIALDLEDFEELKQRLLEKGWSNLPAREHRWVSQRGTLLDLIPAGSRLREAKSITWPQSQFRMSLVGFDHVFSDAQLVTLGDRLPIRVIPPVVLMLLKVVAFLDDQTRRAKDLPDIRALLSMYETDSDRLFSDEVLDANLPDFSLANAYLLGLDLKSICTEEEVEVVRAFLSIVSDDTKPAWLGFVRAAPRPGGRSEEVAQMQLNAFRKGFE